MIYLYHGNDIVTLKHKAGVVVDGLLKRKPDALFTRLDDESWSRAAFDELIQSYGLFEKNYIVLFDRLSLLPADDWKYVLTFLKEMATSSHVFIFLESSLAAADLKKFKTHAEKIITVEQKREAKKEFNTFALADAVGDRDARKAWQLLHESLYIGKAPEEIYGIVMWQLKNIALAHAHSSAEESGLKPFVYQKANRFARSYSQREVRTMTSYLVDIYHQSHRGERDLAEELEKFILKI